MPKVDQPTAINNPCEMIQHALDNATEPHNTVVFLDMDLFLGTYNDPFLCEFSYNDHYRPAKQRDSENIPTKPLFEHLPATDVIREICKNSERVLAYSMFTYLQQTAEFILGDANVIHAIDSLRKAGFDVKILTSRNEVLQKEATERHLETSGLKPHLNLSDVIFVGPDSKRTAAIAYAKANQKHTVYFGDDSADHLMPFYSEEELDFTFHGFHLRDHAHLYAGIHSAYQEYLATWRARQKDPTSPAFFVERFHLLRAEMEAQGHSWDAFMQRRAAASRSKSKATLRT